LAGFAAPSRSEEAAPVSFNRDIRPILWLFRHDVQDAMFDELKPLWLGEGL
jgi:hypothetical protein